MQLQLSFAIANISLAFQQNDNCAFLENSVQISYVPQ